MRIVALLTAATTLLSFLGYPILNNYGAGIISHTGNPHNTDSIDNAIINPITPDIDTLPNTPFQANDPNNNIDINSPSSHPQREEVLKLSAWEQLIQFLAHPFGALEALSTIEASTFVLWSFEIILVFSSLYQLLVGRRAPEPPGDSQPQFEILATMLRQQQQTLFGGTSCHSARDLLESYKTQIDLYQDSLEKLQSQIRQECHKTPTDSDPGQKGPKKKTQTSSHGAQNPQLSKHEIQSPQTKMHENTIVENKQKQTTQESQANQTLQGSIHTQTSQKMGVNDRHFTNFFRHETDSNHKLTQKEIKVDDKNKNNENNDYNDLIGNENDKANPDQNNNNDTDNMNDLVLKNNDNENKDNENNNSNNKKNDKIAKDKNDKINDKINQNKNNDVIKKDKHFNENKNNKNHNESENNENHNQNKNHNESENNENHNQNENDKNHNEKNKDPNNNRHDEDRYHNNNIDEGHDEYHSGDDNDEESTGATNLKKQSPNLDRKTRKHTHVPFNSYNPSDTNSIASINHTFYFLSNEIHKLAQTFRLREERIQDVLLTCSHKMTELRLLMGTIEEENFDLRLRIYQLENEIQEIHRYQD